MDRKVIETLTHEFESLVQKSEELKKGLQNVTERQNAISTLLSLYNKNEENVSFVTPHSNTYPLNGKWKDKIIYAINSLGHPSVPAEITEFLSKQETFPNYSKLKQLIYFYLSDLYKKGVLAADTEGKAYKYKISPEHIQTQDLK